MLFILALYHPDGNMRKASAAIFCLKKEFTLDTISHGTRIITRELNAHGETRKADPWYKNLKKVIGDMALPVIRRHIKELEGASLSGSFQELDTISRDKRMPKTIREKAAELKPIAARSVILKLVSDPLSRKIHNELALVSMDPSMPLEIRAEVNSVLQGLARNLERTSQPAPSRAELERKTKTNELATLLRTMRPPPPSKPPDVVPGIKSLAKLMSN